MSSATSNTSTTSSTTSIIGIVIGSVAALLIIIGIIYFIRKRRAGANVTPPTYTPTAAGNMAAPNTGNGIRNNGNNGLGPKANNYR